MSLSILLIALVWVSLTAYALLGGADFGAGIWDLLAGGPSRGRGPRGLIEHTIGPVWEANHVWLIFVLVLLWTDFPPLFSAISSTLYLPLTFVALGVIARGAAFAFRKASEEPRLQRLFGAAFAFSSLVTPFFLGTIAGALASSRVPPGLAKGDAVTSWLNPTSILTGVFSVLLCAFLAAAYLTFDARRSGDALLHRYFRARLVGSAVAVGVVSLIALAVIDSDTGLFGRLTGRALPLVVVAGVAGLASIGCAATGRDRLLRVTAGLATTAVLWAWGWAQYPYVLFRGLSLDQASAPHSTLVVTSWCVLGGMVILLPSMAWLFVLFQREPAGHTRATASRSS